ncbi:DUF397 domain-containing protein [Streptomyces sp. NBC_01381]|uniref:DUF397 domain-containing protein n=1 Tax=Streptomyces sp. NBC_01381 TaxID=2903845 RepID=UPI002258B41C|nr:DUF397 domain-containing protein [Streptomyces sp. NBC_01381]MCX4669438.1 DUF397 domain-containing protein [Streptomyces sp. NBC_01381]
MRSSRHLSIPDASAVPMWRKSSYSGGSSGDCLEVSDVHLTAAWRKSTYSGGESGDCLEVNDAAYEAHAHIPVRDSKNPHGPAVVFAAPAWTAFVTAVRATGMAPLMAD